MKTKLVRLLGFLATCALGSAEVTRFEIAKRTDINGTGYEKIVGTVYFSDDAKNSRNRGIADLDRAPTASHGRVEFSSDLYLLKPKDPRAGNGAALIEVPNRGRKLMVALNRGGTSDPNNAADLGDQFLLRQGFTLVWVGWESDLPRTPGLLRIDVPAASDMGQPITGIAHATFLVEERTGKFTVNDLAGYPPSDPEGSDSRLVVRSASREQDGATIPRTQWHLSGQTITLEGGFEPGKLYEIFYRSKNPPIAGLGFAAIRDVATWLKHQADAIAPVRYAYAFGSSQSGRFLRNFLYEGFNTDESDRQVFDGVLAHIAGAARINLNRRWSLPTELGTYAATAFPFTDAAQQDPVSGVSEGLLENPRSGHAPKIFYTNTPVEYWGGGRVAALVHTDPAGTADITLPENVRCYFLAGTQHGPANFPPGLTSAGQQRANPTDYWWIMRALLPALHHWVKDGVSPPASAYPTLRDGTLVKADAVSFPAIPGVASPRTLTAGFRVANPLMPGGGGAGAPLPLLVPQVDEDGNERGGLRLPEVAVPLATNTGWNFRKATAGAPGELVALLGSWIPFPATRAARETATDPRRSVEERYASRADYLVKYRDAADALVKQRYLLADDVAPMVKRAGELWDLVSAPAAAKPVSTKN